MNEIKLLDHGYIKFIEHWGSDERIVESARMSHDGGFRGWEKDQRLLEYLYTHKHSTPFEMAGMTIEVKAPIFIFREWHRHRTQSYNEMSARYVPLPNENYIPSVERILEGANTPTKNKQAQGSGRKMTEISAESFRTNLRLSYAAMQSIYEDSLEQGVPKELARLIIPVARYSKMRASANLRNWLAFLTLRMSPDAQWEIRQYANAVGSYVLKAFPRTYDIFVQERLTK